MGIQDFLQLAITTPGVIKNINPFSRQGAKIWDSILQELRKLLKYVFKKNIQNQLLQVLKEENNYVGIPTLINKFQNVCPK